MSHSDRCQAKIPWVGELAARLGALCSSPPLGSHGMDCPGAGSLCGFWVTASVTWGFFFPQLIIFYCCLSENHIMQVASGKESACQCRRLKRCGFDPWVGKISWRRKWQPTLVFLPGESHGQRSLAATTHRVAKSWTGLSENLLEHPENLHLAVARQHAATGDRAAVKTGAFNGRNKTKLIH